MRKRLTWRAKKADFTSGDLKNTIQLAEKAKAQAEDIAKAATLAIRMGIAVGRLADNDAAGVRDDLLRFVGQLDHISFLAHELGEEYKKASKAGELIVRLS